MLFCVEWSARVSIDAEYLYHGSDPTLKQALQTHFEFAERSQILDSLFSLLGRYRDTEDHVLPSTANHYNTYPKSRGEDHDAFNFCQ